MPWEPAGQQPGCWLACAALPVMWLVECCSHLLTEQLQFHVTEVGVEGDTLQQQQQQHLQSQAGTVIPLAGWQQLLRSAQPWILTIGRSLLL